MSEHYQKYKETIKKVSKRNYRARKIWVNEYLGNKTCGYCGESETACLQFYPHERKIRTLTKRKGLNEEGGLLNEELGVLNEEREGFERRT